MFTEDVHSAYNEVIRISDDGSEHFDEIFRFLREISQNEVSALFWESDFLYRITVNWGGNIEKDSFLVIRQIPVRFWPAGFGFSLDQIPEEGMVMEGDSLKGIGDYLKTSHMDSNIFVFDELQDNGKSVSLILMSGWPIE